MKKILLIRFSSIGDIVLTTPVIRCVKQQLKDVELHVLTKKNYVELLSSNPNIDKVFGLEGGLRDLLPTLRNENYDFVIDLHKNFRSLYVRMSLRKPSSSFPKLDLQKLLYTKLKVSHLPDVHIVDRYFCAVERLGVSNDNQGLDFFFHPSDKLNRADYPKRFAAVVIGGQHSTKILPEEKVVDVCKALSLPVVLVGGPEDSARGERIVNAVGGKTINSCGKLKLGQSACVLKYSDVVLTNDTGMMHIAAALRKPIVSVWGNTVPEFGMYPYMPTCPERSSIVENKDVTCRPCHKLGYEKCPKGHFRCMASLDGTMIANEMEKLI